MSDFHEVRFPLDIALGARGGPERRTEIVTLASGREDRNSRWAHSRRRYDAGFGIRTLDALRSRHRLLRGAARPALRLPLARPARLEALRARRRRPRRPTSRIGTGDGVDAAFQLCKPYGGGMRPIAAPIAKPGAGSVRVAVDGVGRRSRRAFRLRSATGHRHLRCRPCCRRPGAVVTAGFLFDVPVRFDTDALEVDLSAFEAGEIPQIPLVEIMA